MSRKEIPTPTYEPYMDPDMGGSVVDIDCIDEDRYTEDAFNILLFARKESCRMGYSYLSTEFILLALISEGCDSLISEFSDLAAKVLNFLGVTQHAIKIEIKKILGKGNIYSPELGILFSPNALKVLELSLEEATQMESDIIGTEHLLLGLLNKNGAVRILENLGIDLVKVRLHVLAELEEKIPNPGKQVKLMDSRVDLKDKENKKKQSDNKFKDRSEENDLVLQLERLASLKEKGLLTEKEFSVAKRRLIY